MAGPGWGKGQGAGLMQRTQGASSSGQCKLQGGPQPRGHLEVGPVGPGDMAPGEATGLCAMHQSLLMRS